MYGLPARLSINSWNMRNLTEKGNIAVLKLRQARALTC